MVVATGITEKRLANKRFRKTEENILKAFLAEGLFTNANTIARKAGIARSTIYHHHHTIRDIIPDYEKFILNKYRCIIHKISKTNLFLSRSIYLKTLCFIVANRQTFQILTHYENNKIFYKMILEISPQIKDSMKLPKNSETLFSVYTSEVANVIENWAQNGFNESELDKVLNKIMFLTDSARTRLAPLLD